MAKKKIQLQDANGNVLHPLTLGECVTMDNGENLDTLMSKSQMFTPTITQDKSMFKVGTGVDVDYSANVKDGAYEGLVLKGKSLVNLMTSCKDETLIEYYNPPANSNVANASMIKPNTAYTIIYSVKYQEEGNTGHLIVRTQQDGGDINVSSGFTFGTTYKRFAYKFTTPSTIDYFVLRSNGHYFHVKEVMLLEGDYTNINIPYFEGLCDSKMPILRNVGKNLFDKNTMKTSWWANQNGVKKDGGNINYSILVPATQNKVYSVSFDASNRSYYAFLDKDYNTLLLQTGYVTNTAPQGTKYLLYYLHNENIDLCGDIQLEETTTKTSYEDYKTNILRTSEEVVLREVDGVQDTYNPLTGEYTKRIGEFILNGSDNETWGNHEVKGDNAKFGYFPTLVAQGTHQSVECLCDKWKADSQANETIQEQISLYNHMPNGTPRTEVRITVSPTRLQSADVTGFRTWLSQNPLTVQYILAQPVTTIVKPSTMTPFAYQNGHVILESGFEGQSLLPEIEYSVVTGRTGQVTQNTKVLRKQEQQITSLEELLLTQVVQMEYERTLLQFDYELQMMMLG